MNSNRIGSLSEAALLKGLTLQGYTVSLPWTTTRYDLVIEKDGVFSRVQVKTGKWHNGVIRVDAVGRDSKGTRGYVGEVDFIGVYCGHLDKCYLIPIAVAGEWGCHLRVDPSKNNQKAKVLWAKDFELGL